mmetsp:Transcript_34644/g.76173  ORF Transcript_34644/g.76173 Transcript_34644/m.76173 type:complete len:219 (-) Transcript_34644:1417-2073(-)
MFQSEALASLKLLHQHQHIRAFGRQVAMGNNNRRIQQLLPRRACQRCRSRLRRDRRPVSSITIACITSPSQRLVLLTRQEDFSSQLTGSPSSQLTTSPAGPVPVVVTSGLKPSSSTGMPNSVSFDSYTRITSLCALVTLASSYWRSLTAAFLASRTSSSFLETAPSMLGSRLAAASTSLSCASFFSRLWLMACILRSSRMFLKPDFCCTSYIVDSNFS